MKIKTDNYVCSICGKRNVKLWSPYMDTAPLICAECAEKRQTTRIYEEVRWTHVSYNYCSGECTGKKRRLPKWEVNEKGQIPTEHGPGPYGEPLAMTNQLFVDISDVSTSYPLGSTSMTPAYPDVDGEFSSTSLDVYKWWEALPTR